MLKSAVAITRSNCRDKPHWLKTNGLIGEVVAEIVLQFLSFIAENERRNIRERQRQGIAAARARGVRFGRPARQLPPQFAECVARLRNGEISLKTAAALCAMPESTFRGKMKMAN